MGLHQGFGGDSKKVLTFSLWGPGRKGDCNRSCLMGKGCRKWRDRQTDSYLGDNV